MNIDGFNRVLAVVSNPKQSEWRGFTQHAYDDKESSSVEKK